MVNELVEMDEMYDYEGVVGKALSIKAANMPLFDLDC